MKYSLESFSIPTGNPSPFHMVSGMVEYCTDMPADKPRPAKRKRRDGKDFAAETARKIGFRNLQRATSSLEKMEGKSNSINGSRHDWKR